MKLYPKARPVRIKLNVGGEEHSSLDSLRANFNVEEVLKLYESGGLQNWLRQINRLDILNQMNKIHKTDSMIEKYRKSIMIFFDCPEIDEYLKWNVAKDYHWSVEEILMEWYDTYPLSFKFLLSSIINRIDIEDTFSDASLEEDKKIIPLVEYHLSVKAARIINEKAKRCKDSATQRLLSKYLYERIKVSLKGIRIIRYGSHKSALEGDNSRNVKSADNDWRLNYRRERLLEQLSKEWNISSEEIMDPNSDMEKILYGLIGNNMVAEFRTELNQLVEHISLCSDLFRNKFTEKEKEELKKTIEYILSSTKDIKIGNISPKDFGLPLLELKSSKRSLTIVKNWFDLPYIIGYFDSTGKLGSLIENWGKLCVYAYLYRYLFDLDGMSVNATRRFLFKYAIDFLNQNKGRSGLYFMLKNTLEKCNRKTIESVSGLRRKIFQSVLLAIILCNESSYYTTASIRDLHETGYRPASLMLGLTQPKNEIERIFMNLNYLERIPFIAEHILDF